MALREEPQELEIVTEIHGDFQKNTVLMIGGIENMIRDNREMRTRELKCFRDSQGVWGDG